MNKLKGEKLENVGPKEGAAPAAPAPMAPGMAPGMAPAPMAPAGGGQPGMAPGAAPTPAV